jgi:hypothetical protein
MPGIDPSRQFEPLAIAVLTVSDTRDLGEDKSGATLVERIEKAGHKLAARAIVKDDVRKIHAQVKAWIKDKKLDVVITTGGTGFTGRIEWIRSCSSSWVSEAKKAFSSRQAHQARWPPRYSAAEPSMPARAKARMPAPRAS